MATKRLFQILAKVEDQPGVVATSLVNVANAKILVSDPVLTYDRETFERNINRTSLSPLTPLEGVVEATCSFRVELAGSSVAAGTGPDWGLLLQACGLKQQIMRSQTISAYSSSGAGPLFSRETATWTTGSGTAEVVHDTWPGSTNLWVANPDGTRTPGTVTGETSGTEITTNSDNGTQGICWRPVSTPTVTLNGISGSGVAAGDIFVGATGGAVIQIETADPTDPVVRILDVGNFISTGEVFNEVGGSGSGQITLASGSFVTQTDWPTISLGLLEDGVIRTIKGCRGSVTFTANLGEPMYMDFEFRGLIDNIVDGALSGTVSPTAVVPPSFIEIGYTLGRDTQINADDEHTPCINSWSLEYRNEIAIERCAASTDGTRGAAFASGRSVTGSFDPSVRPENSYPFLDLYRNGETFRQRLTLGSAAKNSFHFSVPATQITSEGAGDRNGLATRDLQWSASGRNFDAVDGEDREMTLSFHQTAAFVR